jgi:molecular chaperone GrpE
MTGTADYHQREGVVGEPTGSDTGSSSGPVQGHGPADLIPPEPVEVLGVVETDQVEEADEAAEVVEADLDELAYLTAQRDEYLESLQRLQADFDNYRKRMLRQQTQNVERATEALVGKLLPVLDSFDLGRAHGHDQLDPVYRSLLAVLEREGLERLDPLGAPFDPTEHEAVAHEAADIDDSGGGEAQGGQGGKPEVSEVLRAGYRFKGRVLRPAMVKVRG